MYCNPYKKLNTLASHINYDEGHYNWWRRATAINTLFKCKLLYVLLFIMEFYFIVLVIKIYD